MSRAVENVALWGASPGRRLRFRMGWAEVERMRADHDPQALLYFSLSHCRHSGSLVAARQNSVSGARTENAAYDRPRILENRMLSSLGTNGTISSAIALSCRV